MFDRDQQATKQISDAIVHATILLGESLDCRHGTSHSISHDSLLPIDECDVGGLISIVGCLLYSNQFSL